ncbi:MAG: TonB-dependent receptor [Bacteroidales bacterium]|nr:TonB-dependent receptor [Bacteroidales bacterium]
MVRNVFVFILVFLCFPLFAQYSIRGNISGNNGLPLAGASVIIDNSQTGVTSDLNGSFEIKKLPAGSYKLNFSFIGHLSKTVKVELNADYICNIVLDESPIMAEEVIVMATRTNFSASANTMLAKDDIKKNNLGHDVPFLISLTPSVTTTSDAGAGVGYTGFRIRGTDANRINVMVNGVPLNDAESHGVFWVNMPDFASSVDNIHIQRGVGTSTNGAAAFGATIDMQTSGVEEQVYTEISSSAGSFNTFKNTAKIGSGLINDHFSFDMRLSKITSDGFVDRAWSDLKSFYFSGGYFSKSTIAKAVIFSGKEKTYQSWNGVPKVRLLDDSAGMARYYNHELYSAEKTCNMFESDSRTYNFYTYENETDNYQQDHYQFFLSHEAGPLNLNAALHYTYGRGYYEQFRNDDDLADYLLPNIIIGSDTLASTDLVRQKWLDNDFYGTTFSANYNISSIKTTFGGSWNIYNGRHFGNIIWGQYLGETEKDYEWYRNTGVKTDFNLYSKIKYVFNAGSLFVDLQRREITHEIKGLDDDQRNISQKHDFVFFNPKAGFTLTPGLNQTINFFYAVGHREPNRSNYTDAGPGDRQPKPEELHDFELGYKVASFWITAGANAYYMRYNDQLIVTGEINDVGSAIMVNVDKSYRAGIECYAAARLSQKVQWNMNATLSRNKIENFTESVDNWDTWGQEQFFLGTTDLAFSPELIANSIIDLSPVRNLTISFISQYVGKQYIDNTASPDRMLEPYFINNLRLVYRLLPKFAKDIECTLLVNNLFNHEYESNAWVYSYLFGGTRYEMDGYFPQSGINFMGGISVKF